MNTFQTEQEAFWAGNFGDEYSQRNTGQKLLAANIQFFSRILERTRGVRSVIEFGSNIGMNLMAIQQLLPGVEMSAVEINQTAVQEMKKWGGDRIRVHAQSILDFQPEQRHDLALIKGVLIHVNPDRLGDVYRKLYESTGRYLCVAEYYNPTPTAIPYRGNQDRLFKRDFAGEILDKFPDLALIDYGFAYHRDNNYPQDDITWFLMEKR